MRELVLYFLLGNLMKERKMDIIEKIKTKQADFYNQKSITIVFLGDSVTQGCFECYFNKENKLDTFFETDKAYSTILKKMLNKLYPKVQFNIINSGLSGDSAPNGLKRMDRDVFAYNPDLVVVAFALNDSCQGVNGLDKYGRAIEDILLKLKENNVESIILTPNAMNTEVSCFLNDNRLIALANSFADVQNSGLLKLYVEKAKNIAQKHDIKVCDVYAWWETMIKSGVETTELLSNKLNHPIREMHYFTAIKLLETILN